MEEVSAEADMARLRVSALANAPGGWNPHPPEDVMKIVFPENEEDVMSLCPFEWRV